MAMTPTVTPPFVRLSYPHLESSVRDGAVWKVLMDLYDTTGGAGVNEREEMCEISCQ